MRKHNVGPDLKTFMQSTSKWTIDLNGTIKEEHLGDPGHNDDFLDTTPKARCVKGEREKPDFEISTFRSVKGSVNSIKDKPQARAR